MIDKSTCGKVIKYKAHQNLIVVAYTRKGKKMMCKKIGF